MPDMEKTTATASAAAIDLDQFKCKKHIHGCLVGRRGTEETGFEWWVLDGAPAAPYPLPRSKFRGAGKRAEVKTLKRIVGEELRARAAILDALRAGVPAPSWAKIDLAAPADPQPAPADPPAAADSLECTLQLQKALQRATQAEAEVERTNAAFEQLVGEYDRDLEAARKEGHAAGYAEGEAAVRATLPDGAGAIPAPAALDPRLVADLVGTGLAAFLEAGA